MLKALMLVPPTFGRFDNVGARCQGTRRTKSLWYPIWLAQAVANTPGAKLYDAAATEATVEETLELARNFDVIMIHPSEGSLPLDALFAQRLKTLSKQCKIIFGGQSATVLANQILENYHWVDSVAIDEYDETIKEIVTSGSLNVRGSLQRDTPFEPREKPQDLDALGWVTPIYNRDLDVKRYYLPFVTRPYLQIYDSRGCTARCTFCLTPQVFTNEHATLKKSNPIRYRSVDDVLNEMSWIKCEMPNIKEVFIDSDTFTDRANVVSGRFKEICKGLKAVGLKWSCNVRADANAEILETLKQSGCRLIVVGYESVDDNILRGIKKGISSAQAERFTNEAEKRNLMIQACFIVGLPGETWRSVDRTFKFALKHNFNNIQVAPAHAFKGTELYRTVENAGYLHTQLLDVKGRQLPQISQPQFSAEETANAIELFLRGFLYRPRYVYRLLKDIARGDGELERIIRNIREYSKDIIQRGI